ncbi:MAG: hypothetical protein K9M51_02970 [Candidatus Gracilibacteria bacterium]|nr:hypothetical protein [Candidatus Gracilibacteria bacterium]
MKKMIPLFLAVAMLVPSLASALDYEAHNLPVRGETEALYDYYDRLDRDQFDRYRRVRAEERKAEEDAKRQTFFNWIRARYDALTGAEDAEESRKETEKEYLKERWEDAKETQAEYREDWKEMNPKDRQDMMPPRRVPPSKMLLLPPSEEGTDDTSGEIPNDCQVYFDGCNKCKIGENGRMACTKMFCFEKKEPKCLEYFSDEREHQKLGRPPRDEVLPIAVEEKEEVYPSKETLPMCMNSPSSDFCAAGKGALYPKGKDEKGCPIWACKGSGMLESSTEIPVQKHRQPIQRSTIESGEVERPVRDRSYLRRQPFRGTKIQTNPEGKKMMPMTEGVQKVKTQNRSAIEKLLKFRFVDPFGGSR